ncbi:hypothetical protein C9374_010286 [Naegleria lovaniensis]|uniref:Right handed beta helix domain-containing protein n=1 Tax=Naegleria lovaniensis TaxID=51637 RepID=A0AA88GC65_NAELO|nr:uncharacterized protein C9374_010286 [Naegleria lovaniensis]KAG2374912.1 hypothetical protein C9374_010286 [Naegleria lovaniensis]
MDTYSIPYASFVSRVIVNKDKDLQYKVNVVKKSSSSQQRSTTSSENVEVQISYDSSLGGVGYVGYSLDSINGAISLQLAKANQTPLASGSVPVQPSTSVVTPKPSSNQTKPLKSHVVSAATSMIREGGRIFWFSLFAMLSTGMYMLFTISKFKNPFHQTMTLTMFVLALSLVVASTSSSFLNADIDAMTEIKNGKLACAIPTITVLVPQIYEFDINQEDPSLSPQFKTEVSFAPQQYTTSFQNGRDGYKDEEAITISTMYIDTWNEMNGQTFYEDDVVFVGHNSQYEARVLMRFRNLQGKLPPGAVVSSASLDLTYVAWVKGCKIQVHHINTSWVAAQKTGWRFKNYATREEWRIPGAAGDVVLNSYSKMEKAMSDIGNQIKSISLDPYIVQKWFDNNTENYGVLLREVPGTFVRPTIFGGNSSIAYRPRLTVTYQFQPMKPPQYPMVLTEIPVKFFVQSNTSNCNVTACGNDDTGSGTITAPFRSVAKALTLAQDGDVILLREGVHAGGLTIDRENITIQAYGLEKAVIASPVNNPQQAINVYLRRGSSGSVLRNLELIGGFDYNIRIESSIDWGGNNAKFGASNIVIERCKIHDSGYHLIKIDSLCNNVIIRNNEFYNSGVRVRTGGSAIVLYDTYLTRIQDNMIHHTMGAAIMIKSGARNSIVERNYITNSYGAGVLVGFYETSEYFSDANQNPLYYQAVNTIVRNNIIANTSGAGIGLYSAKNPQIVFNTIWAAAQDNQAAILINLVQTWVSNSYSPITPCINVTLTNNVICTSRDRIIEIRTLTSYVDDSVVGGLEGQSLNVSYNRYYSLHLGSSGGVFSDQRNSIGYVGGFSGWKSKYNDIGSSEGNPFIDTIAFYPQYPSPLIFSGVEIAGIISDYFGRPMIKGKISIGALQFMNDGFSDDPTKKYSITNIIYRLPYRGSAPPKDVLPTWSPPTTYRVIYVSPTTGSDSSGNGTLEFPYKTIRKVTNVAFMKDNDIIILRGGTYNEGGISITSNNVTIKAFDNEVPIITSSMNDATQMNVFKIYSQFVTLEGLEIIGGFYYGVMVERSDVVIRKAKIHHTGSDCIKLSPFSKRVTITQSEIYQCGKRTTYQQGNPNQGAASTDAIRAVNVDDLIVSQNYIHDIAGSAIKTQGGGQRALIERNLILNVQGLGVTVGFYEETSYMDPTQNPDYYEAIDAVVKNNIIVNVQGAGVGLYASKNSKVLHNTLVNVALSMQVPILIVASPHTMNAVQSRGQSNHAPMIVNNIIQLSEAGVSQLIYEVRVQDGDGLDQSQLSSDCNIYFSNYNNYHGNSQASISFLDRRLTSFISTSDLDSWRKHINSDYNSSIADPLLDSNLKIGIQSPARGKAMFLSEVTEDFYGNSRTKVNNDIGALLYSSDLSNSSVTLFPPAFSTIIQTSSSNQCSNYTFILPRTFYVDNVHGRDGDCLGTFSNPFKTINQALAVAPSGSNITLRYTGVTYNESLSIRTPYIRISTYENDPKEALIVSSIYNSFILHTIRFEASAIDSSLERVELQGGFFYTLKIDADQVTVKNCIIHNCGTKCVFILKANNVTLTSSEVYDSGSRLPSEGEGVHALASHHFTCTDNYIHDIAADGVKIEGGCRESYIERNAISNADRGILVGGRTDSIQLFDTNSNPELYESIDATVSNNILMAIFGAGIGVYGSKNAHVIHNTIIDASQSNQVSAPLHVTSTLHRNGLLTPVYSPWILNNLIFNKETISSPLFRIDEGSSLNASITGGSIVINNNVYYNKNKTALFVDGRKNTAFSGSLSNWKTKIQSYFSGSNEANSLEGDPQLNSQHLSPSLSSMATNAGHASTTDLDFYGNTRNPNSIDIGAVISSNSVGPLSKHVPRTLPTNISQIAVAKSSSMASIRYPPTGNQKTWSAPGYTSDDAGEFDLACPVFLPDHPFNQDISNLPVHPRSDAFINNVARKYLHADFGTVYDGALNGIPYIIVTKDQPKVGIQITSYASESDITTYPFPEGAPIEGGPNSNGDRHIIAIDKDNCKLYETWRTFVIDKQYRDTTGGGNVFTAECGAIFNLNTSKAIQRPLGWTSADAAGLPIFPLLVRYDEVVVKKEIKHAIRFTVVKSQKAFISPASHFASSLTDPNLLPMGARIRMKASYDCSSYSEEVQVICTALKKYGAYMADNGQDWYFSGAPHPMWNDNHLNDMKKIPSTALEVVYTEKTCLDATCSTWRDELN